MAEKLIHIFKEFLNLIFPQKCLGCGMKNKILCRKCLVKLPFCEPYESYEIRSRKIFAATSYQDEIVKKTIWLFKYKGVKILSEPFAELIYNRLENRLRLNIERNRTSFVIIPIPLSKKKLRKRGYNQAELLAKYLSDKLSVRTFSDVLYKIRDTLSQVEIKNKEKRLKNLEGAFKVENLEQIVGKTIILVDDISTTGATLKEASRVLKSAGAKKVIGLVVARG